jgi:hypothetical protein
MLMFSFLCLVPGRARHFRLRLAAAGQAVRAVGRELDLRTIKYGRAMKQKDPPIEEVCICMLEDYHVRELAKHLVEVTVI